MCPAPKSREVSPAEQAIQNEQERLDLNPEELEAFREALRVLRRRSPHLYVVLKAWSEERVLRSEPSEYRHGVGRGFYSRLAKRFRLRRQTILYRLREAMKLAADLLDTHEQS